MVKHNTMSTAVCGILQWVGGVNLIDNARMYMQDKAKFLFIQKPLTKF